MQQTEWVALDGATDPRSRARELAQIHHRALSGGSVRGELREVVARSWTRCSGAGVDPEHSLAPVVMDEAEASQRWERHPLSIGRSLMLALLEQLPADVPQVALVCAADGTLLWLGGEPRARAAAAEIHLGPGTRWSETEAGTNAMGTALAVDHALQIFSGEHFSSCVHDWTCSAAPVHDPETDELLGVLDLSGPAVSADPNSVPLVAAAARMVETVLALRAAERQAALRERLQDRVGRARGQADALVSAAGRVLADRHGAWTGRRIAIPPEGGAVAVVPGATVWAEPVPERDGFLLFGEARSTPLHEGRARLQALGRDRLLLELDGVTHTLSRRHSEILVLLATRPRGLNAEQLALELYGDFGKPVTIRAEMSRLRALLGDRLLAAPYRLADTPRTDFAALAERIGVAPLTEVVADYAGPLLPRSEVPGVVEIREWLDQRVRGAVLGSGDGAALVAWLRGESGQDDVVACRALVDLLPAGDPDRPFALSRLRRLTGSGRFARTPATGGPPGPASPADSVGADEHERRPRVRTPAPGGDTRPAEAARGLSLTQLP